MLVEGSPHNMISALRFTMVYCHSEENKSNIFSKNFPTQGTNKSCVQDK